MVLSLNMLKNAMGVGIPEPERLAWIWPQLWSLWRQGLCQFGSIARYYPEMSSRLNSFSISKVNIALKDTPDVLYIESFSSVSQETARVVIQGDYTRVILIERNGHPLFKLDQEALHGEQESQAAFKTLTEDIYHFAIHAPLKNLHLFWKRPG